MYFEQIDGRYWDYNENQDLKDLIIEVKMKKVVVEGMLKLYLNVEGKEVVKDLMMMILIEGSYILID